MRVLLVEDEQAVAKPLQKALQREGYRVAVSETGTNALELARSWKPDVILLDLMLPDLDGQKVAREIRSWSEVPIIMVTARGEEEDRVTGLDAGADDYVVKPFSLRELMARIRAVTRRGASPAGASGAIEVKDLRLDLEEHRAWKGDEELQLTRKEFELLRMLIGRPGSVVRREELVRGVWNVSHAEGAKTLDVHVSWLRSKLRDDPRNPTYIETVRGVGFRLVSD